MTATPLLDRIHPERRTDSLTPLIERRGGEERRLPDRFPPKDMTPWVAGRAA